MKKLFSRKIISIFVMIAFVSMFCFPVHPAQEKVEKTGEKVLEQEIKGKVEAESEAEVDEYYSRDDANVIEDEGYQGRKRGKFPWLLVVGGLVVVGVVLYFLVIKKKKYDLTVTVGEGVTGTPASGTTTYKEGSTVSYNYSLQSGYSDLIVKVDGAVVAASGTITMDKDTSLTATATEVATLIVNSNPTGAQIIMDGTASGETTNHTFMFTTGGNHTVKLRKVGYMQYSTSKSVAVGDTETINKTLTKGLREYFSTDATSSILWKWNPHPSGNWSVTGGKYVANAAVSDYNYSVYNYNWASDKYTVTVRMNRAVGNQSSTNSVLLTAGTNATSFDGYLFTYRANGHVGVWKMSDMDLKNGSTGAWSVIKGWTASAAVVTGLGNYNTLKIIRNGNNYTYYLNNTLITSFSDTSHDPRYIVLEGYNGGVTTQLNFDYAFVDIGSTAGSVPGKLVRSGQGKTGQNIDPNSRR